MLRNRRNSPDTLSFENRHFASPLKLLEVIIRSFIFNVTFFITFPLLLILNSPALLLKRPPFYFAKLGTGHTLWLLKVICGLKYKVDGLENVPEGKCIFASKHQSAWDTVIFQYLFPKAIYVLKKELLRIPFYGNFIKKFGMIGIDRKEGRKSLATLIAQARIIAEQDRKIIIFPEGSRTQPFEKATYHKGIYLLYKDLKTCPVVPVALNSGVFWGRRSFLRWPGVITIRFLKPVAQGLEADQFMSHLEDRIENESKELLSSLNKSMRTA